MVFLFNQTDEELKLRCDITEKDGEKEMVLAMVFPNQYYVNLLHTKSQAIINAAQTRFRLGIASIHPDQLVGHDFYISKRVAGYGINTDEKNDPAMAEIVPCNPNPSKDRDTPRNLAVAVFKRDETDQENTKNAHLRTYDTNDTSLTKIETVSIHDKNTSAVYEFHFLAIKWVGWFRLKRQSYLVVENGDKKKFYRFSSVPSKIKSDHYNDWLQPMSDEETAAMLEAARVEATNKANSRRTQDVSKPRSDKQRPNNNRPKKQPYRNGNNNQRPNNGQNRNGSGGNRPKSGSGSSHGQKRPNQNSNHRSNNGNNKYYKKKHY